MQEHLYRMDFDADELKKLPKVHVAFLVSSCVAITDITTFLRLFLLAINAPNFKGSKIDEVVSDYSLTQALVIQRTLSGKLKEYIYMCEQYQSTCEKRSDDTLHKFRQKTLQKCTQLKCAPEYELVDWYRDKVTHHYIVSHISELTNHMQSGENYSIFMHDRDGNNGYFLGEQILFHKLGIGSKDEIFAKADGFLNWVITAARIVQELHHDYCIQFLETFFPNKVAREISIDVPDDMVGKLGATQLPCFWDFQELTK